MWKVPFFFLWAKQYFPQYLILERKMVQEGLYSQRHILGNVMSSWIAWKWKRIKTQDICSAAPLRNGSNTYPEILDSWPTLCPMLSFLGSQLSKEQYVFCVGKPALSRRRKDLNFKSWQIFSANLRKSELYLSSKSTSPSLLLWDLFFLLFVCSFLWVYFVYFILVLVLSQFLSISSMSLDHTVEGTCWDKDRVYIKWRVCLQCNGKGL